MRAYHRQSSDELVVEPFPSKDLHSWCQLNKSKPTGAGVQATVTKSTSGQSESFSTKCLPACSSLTSQKRHPIKWHSNFSIERSRKAHGPGQPTSKWQSNALNSYVKPCSKILSKGHLGLRCNSTLSSHRQSQTKYLWTSYLTRNQQKASNSSKERFMSIQRTQVSTSACTKPK